MKTFELQEGLLAMLEEVLAVTTEQIAEDQMTLPDELADLIRVETFADQGNLTDTGLVLRQGWCRISNHHSPVGIDRERTNNHDHEEDDNQGGNQKARREKAGGEEGRGEARPEESGGKNRAPRTKA